MSEDVYRIGTYGIVRYGISRQCVLVLVPVPYRYGICSRLSQISFALTGLAAHANHLFYRFRTDFVYFT